MSNQKRIIIHDYAGHPFQFDLSKNLAQKGYDILHVFTSASGGPIAGFEHSLSNLQVENIPIDRFRKNNFVERAAQEYKYGKKVLSLFDRWKPDLIISANAPLLAQKQIVKWCNQNKVPTVFWLQDLLSLAAKSILSRKIPLAGSLVAAYFHRVELKALNRSDHIIAVTEDFLPILKNWGLQENKVSVIRNWSPIESVPVLPKDNDFAREHGLQDRFVVLYSGTLGMKQNPQYIYDLAERLERNNPDIVLVVVSEGVGIELLRENQKKKHLSNLKLLPFQPFKILPQVLASADVLLSILDDEAGTYCVPSKVWTGFCAQRPALLVVPESNLAAKVTRQIDAGIIVSGDVINNLEKAVLRLKNERETREKMAWNARRYAEENFEINNIANKFEHIFHQLLQA
ncbi:MAG TPA: glycosyltransferase WbuB [Caldithrix abyssi]|uniref:Glycosyltransferase WbuB n=1 Tax=Caldithrix abyssi TaxID=187145 RepID=A0A7V4TYH4_CALAY|nr:glycosyltransferase WbuB [Caldithrix abyssi]